MEPFLRLGLLAVQDDGEGQDVDEQTPGAMTIYVMMMVMKVRRMMIVEVIMVAMIVMVTMVMMMVILIKRWNPTKLLSSL